MAPSDNWKQYYYFISMDLWFSHMGNYWPFTWGIHQWLSVSLLKGPVIQKAVQCYDTILIIACFLLQGYRKSKWDRPKEPPPPPVNRTAEGDQLQQNEEVTSSESTKLLVSRFREIERGDNATYQSERKPVHKITPPRDELARGIEEAERIYQEEETTVQSERRQEDLPPPSITKNKLAIFRSMEEDSQAPPSPARSSYSTTTVTRTQHSVTTHSHIKASPDSGISDSEQQGTGHRSDDDLDGDVMTRSDVIRAEDKAEEDLPEQGFTKSLLAQWKQKEIESTYSRDSSPHSTSSQQTWNSNRRTDTHRRPPKKIVQTPDSDISSADEHAYENIPPRGGGMNGDMEGSEYSGSVREVIRESDRNDEDELPPPSFTKNMLAKFQSMQEEATRDTYVRPPVKKVRYASNDCHGGETLTTEGNRSLSNLTHDMGW